MTAAHAPRDSAPRFSIVSAVYNVARYLGEFIASVEAQTFPLDRVEVIVVDDGSTDDSLARLQAWRDRRPGLVTVLTKPNGGQSSARNLGLRHARGEWVTFTDPDDTIGPTYLGAVDDFLRAQPTASMIACRRVLLMAATGEYKTHPLDHHFAAGDRLVDLDQSPDLFPGSAPCAFFPRPEVRGMQLEFNELLRPHFEDGYFPSRYLLAAPSRLVGLVASAVYTYRRRGDGSSTSEGSYQHPGRYTTVPRLGYLDLLRRGAELPGGVPVWVQNLVIYDLSWNFSEEDRPSEVVTAARGAVAAEFHQLLAELLAFIDPAVIEAFNARRLSPVWRELLAYGYRDTAWRPDAVVRDRRDRRQRLDRVRYRFTGALPSETYTVDGVPVKPVHAKVRDLPYFDRTVIRERLVWLPRGDLDVSLDGVDVEVRKAERRPAPPVGAADPAAVPRRRLPVPSTDKVVLRLARTRLVRRYFRSAWVLMDRIEDADDSAEHLFRYLRKQQRSINAWFVIERGTPDHTRLRSAGYRRLIAHGSVRWKLLMLNCDHLVSSHADAAIVRPHALRPLVPRPAWRFTFLQHGVIKDDISGWLNSKHIDVFVTSTPGEYESICGDGTRYIYTSKEAQLTGMPRFDSLLEVGRRFPSELRDLVLIAPTWRTWLVAPESPGSQRRVIAPGFVDTEFARQWRAVVNSPELAEVSERAGLRVATLLHPNLQSVRDELDLPPNVATFGFVGTNVRELFARSRVVVTDYSSMAFNAAYIDRPVVYFQFDHAEMFGGAHVGHRGYFDYARDGFGPVTFDAATAVAAVREIVQRGPAPAEQYRHRIEAAFPNRDGRCCERVYDAIRASVRPASESETVSGGATSAGAAGRAPDASVGPA